MRIYLDVFCLNVLMTTYHRTEFILKPKRFCLSFRIVKKVNGILLQAVP